LARSSFFSSSESGFTLVETLVASAILVASLVSLAELFVIATRSNAVAKNGGMTMILAQQKMEQLRGLTWGFDPIGLPLSDTTTDTAQVPEASGGTGLLPSPPNSLWSNTVGYVDYISATGRSLGGGSNVPTGTAYIRRWSIDPLPTNPNNTLIIQVLVTRPGTQDGTQKLGTRFPEESRLISIKTRKTQ
jgi:prepilin-type N-terminal cleavage/methylation domain-containing protein